MSELDLEKVIPFARGLINGLTRDDFIRLGMLRTPSDEIAFREASTNTEKWANVVPEPEVGVGVVSEELWQEWKDKGIV